MRPNIRLRPGNSFCVALRVAFVASIQFLSSARADDDASNQSDLFTQVHSATEQEGLTFFTQAVLTLTGMHW